MTKAERAALDAAQTEVALLRALRLHDPVLPDIPAPREGHTEGWFTSYRNVHRGWSEFGAHGEGAYVPPSDRNRHESREGICLYSTEALAWQEVRARLAWEYAGTLAALDKRIADLTNPTPKD